MFDGVHLGHKSIIDELIKVGSQNDLETAILTFGHIQDLFLILMKILNF
jgi:FAD synthase